jgi:uncharacterized membrane protein YkvA (DUF1232 family)
MPQRRHYAGPVDLRNSAFPAFLRTAEELTQGPTAFNTDQLADSARWLLDHHAHQLQAPCVRARMHVIAVLRALRAESNWALPPESAALVQRLLSYHDGPEHVIPTRLPVLGHLDDAILLDAIWLRIRDDVHEYMDFRRLRRIEAELRGVLPSRLPYTRQDWQMAYEVECKLQEEFRRNGLDRYTRSMTDVPRFQVH